MDPLHLCIALSPVTVYLFLMGLINLSPRPFSTSGLRDATALAVAVSGLAVVGPLNLFVPEAAIFRFGSFVWPMLLGLYGLGATLVVLMLRPRLVFYNVTVIQLRPVLGSVVQQLDNQARWAGDSLLLPQLGIQLHLEEFSVMRNVQLVSSGPKQNFTGWRRLELEMRRSLSTTRATRNPRGASLIAISLAITVVIAISMVNGQQSVAQAVTDLLRFQ